MHIDEKQTKTATAVAKFVDGTRKLALKFVDSGACGSVADLQVEIVEATDKLDLLHGLNLGCVTCRNFSSHEYQTLKATDDTPGAQVTPKPMVWTTPPVFTNTRLSENLTSPTPKWMNQSSSTPARDHENRMGTASMEHVKEIS